MIRPYPTLNILMLCILHIFSKSGLGTILFKVTSHISTQIHCVRCWHSELSRSKTYFQLNSQGSWTIASKYCQKTLSNYLILQMKLWWYLLYIKLRIFFWINFTNEIPYKNYLILIYISLVSSEVKVFHALIRHLYFLFCEQ